jgi:hypothetical protein
MGALAGPADSGGSSLEKPEFLCVVSLHAAVLVVPVVPGRLGDLEVPGYVLQRSALSEELVAFGELAGDLLGRVPSALYAAVSSMFHAVVSSNPTSWGSGSHRGWIS